MGRNTCTCMDSTIIAMPIPTTGVMVIMATDTTMHTPMPMTVTGTDRFMTVTGTDKSMTVTGTDTPLPTAVCNTTPMPSTMAMMLKKMNSPGKADMGLSPMKVPMLRGQGLTP